MAVISAEKTVNVIFTSFFCIFTG